MHVRLLRYTAVLALVCSAATATAAPIFSDATPGLTTFTVPEAGLYNIMAEGAQGGVSFSGYGSPFSGGYGAVAGGDFLLAQGQVLTIAVGGRGADGIVQFIFNDPSYASGSKFGGGGGGGGSFVVDSSGAPLLVAGGGGGASGFSRGGPGQAGTSGQGVYDSYTMTSSGVGGVNGSGGPGSDGGGGGGLYSAGGTAMPFPYGTGGSSRPSFVGGLGAAALGGSGGFGGGGGGGLGGSGAGGHSSAGGGGGGGFSGGAGAAFNDGGGGGGGSFNGGLNDQQRFVLAGFNSGNGSVTITELEALPVIEPASVALLGLGIAGLIETRRRRR